MRRHLRRPGVSAGLVVVVAAGISVSLGVAQRRPPLDWFFLTVVLGGALLVARLSWLSLRRAVRQHALSVEAAARDPRTAARSAVMEERRLLSRDIEASVRASLAAVVERVRSLDQVTDPRPALREIQAEASHGNLELRRRLGLLRAEERVGGGEPSVTSGTTRGWRGGDLVPTLATLALAALDIAVFAPIAGVTPGPLQIVFTLGAAVTPLGRRRAPAWSGAIWAALVTVASVVQAAVLDGFAFALTLGLLAWSCAAQNTWRSWLVVVVLAGAAVGSRLLSHPDNLGILLVLFAIAVVGGATFGRSERREQLARARTEAEERELRAAAELATAAERRTVARELHDVISHAVSVIAVQAGAAEMAWPVDPDASRRGIGVIETVATQAVSELDRLVPGRVPVRRDVEDFWALIARMRAAGLRVTVRPPPQWESPVPETLYRVVQETLTNALRHAPDSQVLIRIDTEQDTTTVIVADDGPGAGVGTRRGYGLIGLGERLRQVGGSLSTRTAPEVSGFEVTAVLPHPTTVVTP